MQNPCPRTETVQLPPSQTTTSTMPVAGAEIESSRSPKKQQSLSSRVSPPSSQSRPLRRSPSRSPADHRRNRSRHRHPRATVCSERSTAHSSLCCGGVHRSRRCCASSCLKTNQGSREWRTSSRRESNRRPPESWQLSSGNAPRSSAATISNSKPVNHRRWHTCRRHPANRSWYPYRRPQCSARA